MRAGERGGDPGCGGGGPDLAGDVGVGAGPRGAVVTDPETARRAAIVQAVRSVTDREAP